MLALALLTFWLDRAVHEEERQPSLRRHDPDYIVDNFTIRNFDRNGDIASTLAASKMVHFPDDDSTELIAPRVVQTKPNEPRMTVQADRGALSQDGAEIFLYDNVLLVRDATKEAPAARMTTSFLHIVRSRSLVLTDRHVVITEKGRSLEGRGMEYSNETQQLFLRSHVRGTMDPKTTD